MIVKGSINAQCFEEWMKQHLFKELPKGCTIIMDNAPIHRKSVIMDLATASGHTVIFLPKYSPDFNKIEHDFAALKKRRTYAPIGTSLDSVVADYANRKNL